MIFSDVPYWDGRCRGARARPGWWSAGTNRPNAVSQCLGSLRHPKNPCRGSMARPEPCLIWIFSTNPAGSPRNFLWSIVISNRPYPAHQVTVPNLQRFIPWAAWSACGSRGRTRWTPRIGPSSSDRNWVRYYIKDIFASRPNALASSGISTSPC